MKKNKFLYKKLGPLLGKLLDKLFFTNFEKVSSNYYHQYDQNDYVFDKKQYCFVHVPRTGGWSFRNYYEKFKLPFYVNKVAGHHNPVSLLCSPKEYKYVTIIRDPIQRVRSHYQMFQKAKVNSASRGFINFLRYCPEVKNLYCQYFSGLVGETVDERIFKIAYNNIKYFKGVILFENYNQEINKFFKNFDILEVKAEFHANKSLHKELSKNEIEAIKIYNYWDLKLYEEILKTKN